MVELRARPLASLPTDKLSTGDPQLDAALGGGLPVGSLTEVTGEWRHCQSPPQLAEHLRAAPAAAAAAAAHLLPAALAGEAAASKTQLSLQLLLSAQLPRQYGGLEGSAVYVYTEGDPAMRRLHQLARWLHLRCARAMAGWAACAVHVQEECSCSRP